MSFWKKVFADKKALSSAIAATLLFVSVVVMLIAVMPRTKAWFAKNDQTTANGISLSAKEQYLRFDDHFTARAVMNDVTVAEGKYKRHTDGKYYLVDEDGNYKLENGKMQSLFYDSLYPGEYIEMTFRIACSEDQIGKNFKLSLSGLDGSDTFETKATDSSAAATYSIWGVYHAYSKVATNAEQDVGFVVDYTQQSLAPQTFDLASGVWDEKAFDGDGYLTVTVRFHIDLTNYNKLSGTYSNLLSEKSARISNFVLAPAI